MATQYLQRNLHCNTMLPASLWHFCTNWFWWCFALVLDSFTFLELHLKILKCAQNLFYHCTAVRVFIKSASLCVCISMYLRKKKKKPPHQAKDQKRLDDGNSLCPCRDLIPNPCTYFTLDYADRSLYHWAIQSLSTMHWPYWFLNNGKFIHSSTWCTCKWVGRRGSASKRR